MKRLVNVVMGLLYVMVVISCGSSEKPKPSAKTFEVKAHPLHQTLHFTGTIQPLREYSVISPMEAVVQQMDFHYGQLVKKGDVILTLSSNELQKQYNVTLTDYLKAKDSYSIAKAKFGGTEELWQAGLIAKNNYLSEKSSVDTSRVALMQAKGKLTEMLEQMDETNANHVSSLKLADFDKVSKILTKSHQLIHLKATGDGVLLYPPKTGDDKTSRINVGSSVKSAQVIALVGDLRGIKVEIDVPEIDIDKIRPGMKAIVSGVAFGRHPLKGSLIAVNAQASNTNTGGLPSFTAVVEVPALSPEEQPLIKVGMSAAIELSVDSLPKITVPISAVMREKGASFVRLQSAKGAIEKRIITTGTAQADSVVVEAGLKAGDVVVYG
jgi:multidrug efflux pump subunit AcrA (membrane-fusion protein)